MTLINLAVAAIASISTLAVAAPQVDKSEAAAEKLILAMRLDRKTKERMGESAKAIQAYMAEGIVDKAPNLREEYTDYYIVRKPASFMGHKLVVLEEEYMAKFVGCCVNEGVGSTVLLVGSSLAMEDFAENNGCSYWEGDAAAAALPARGRPRKLPDGRYASLSCRTRDVHGVTETMGADIRDAR